MDYPANVTDIIAALLRSLARCYAPVGSQCDIIERKGRERERGGGGQGGRKQPTGRLALSPDNDDKKNVANGEISTMRIDANHEGRGGARGNQRGIFEARYARANRIG